MGCVMSDYFTFSSDGTISSSTGATWVVSNYVPEEMAPKVKRAEFDSADEIRAHGMGVTWQN